MSEVYSVLLYNDEVLIPLIPQGCGKCITKLKNNIVELWWKIVHVGNSKSKARKSLGQITNRALPLSQGKCKTTLWLTWAEILQDRKKD